MRTIITSRWMLASLALLTTVSIAGCGASRAPGNGHTTDAAASSAPAETAAPSAATSTAPSGVRNLTVSSAERSKLTASFVAFKGISPADVLGTAPLPGSVYYAYVPATDTYWALAEFRPSSTASLQVQVSFQDGGNYGMFRKVGSGAWQAQTPGWPPVCDEAQYFPTSVLRTWALPTSPPPGESGC